MGVVNVPGRLNGSYFWDVPRRSGGISFVSQSGAYGGLFFREVRARGLGVARFVSIGNQADLGFVECLDWLGADPDTRVVALFVEGVRDGRAFVEAARRVAAAKPVVAFKVGRGSAGHRAAGSHTGSLAGSYPTYLAAFQAAGIGVVAETDELFDAIAALDAHGSRLPRGGGRHPHRVRRPLGRRGGRRRGGGPHGARAAGGGAAGLAGHLPSFGADGNPVDLTPQMDPRRWAGGAARPRIRRGGGRDRHRRRP